MAARLLLAEDDRSVRTALARALELEGYDVELAENGEVALAACKEREPDLVIADWMMPYLDGVTLCQRLRAARSQTPILMLTARTELSDRVAALDAGADDFLAKPFALEELLARVRALLRRSSYADDDSPEAISAADVRLDVASRRAWRGDREISFTKTEFDLVEVLVRQSPTVCTPTMLYDMVWGYDFGPESKTLAVFIGYIRRKLEHDGEAQVLHTVRGVGYSLRAS
jgi:two-component system, OmpR family, response regulator MprA